MPVYRIPAEHLFPPVSHGEPDGLLGVGGDLDPNRLELAYRSGIFPWYSEGQPILWFSPDPRFVLYTAELEVPRSLKKIVRRGDFRITMDTAFAEVIAHCRQRPRPGQRGTWITGAMEQAYNELYARGQAHSVEAWLGERLVGGLYGISFGHFFAGESMFALEPDASKVGFVHLAQQLQAWGFPLIDSQVHTAHLERFGGRHVPRRRYLVEVDQLFRQPRPAGPWRFDEGFVPQL